jgi:Ala-tRNA(Pro) deacylase
MPIRRLRELLDGYQVKYTVISHSPAYTAQEVAESSHITGKEIAKTIIVELDGELTMVVVPASRDIDFEYLKEETDSEHAELVKEDQFKDRFPDCEVGAMPPFGHLYGMKLIVDDRLSQDREIAFNAGNHRELVRMRFSDYKRVAEPRILDLTSFHHKRATKAKK